jgi:hypothetical protein
MMNYCIPWWRRRWQRFTCRVDDLHTSLLLQREGVVEDVPHIAMRKMPPTNRLNMLDTQHIPNDLLLPYQMP